MENNAEKYNCEEESFHHLCHNIPKAELHLHIEGTLEPELMMKIAKRNNVEIPYKSLAELKLKYKFKNLQEFLDLLDSCLYIYKTELDYEELAYEYFERSNKQGLKYVEMFFGPDIHTILGNSLETVVNGLKRGMDRAQAEFGIESHLILTLVRNNPVEKSLKTLEECVKYKDIIKGIDLAGSELAFPPELFVDLYKRAAELGFRLTAHAGEEGSCSFVENAVNLLKVERLNHGVAALKDDDLLEKCAKMNIAFTVCPLSNLELQVFKDLKSLDIRKMLEKNIVVMINSDDPAYFGGYIGDNYVAIQKALNLSKEEIITLAKNSFKAAFLLDEAKEKYYKLIDKFINENIQ